MAANTNAGELHVHISGLSAIKGKVYFTLCETQKCFESPNDNDASFYAMIVLKVAVERPTLTITHLPKGEYAAFAFHDINNNDNFDLSFLGHPKEAFAYSNQLPVETDAFFHQAKFSVPELGTVLQHLELALPHKAEE